MKPRFIFVMHAEHFPQLFGKEELVRLRGLVDLVEPSVNASQLRAAGSRFDDVEGIISGWGMPELSPELLKAMPRLRAVFHAAGTIKSIATDASWDRGIRISSAALENARPTAEFAFAEIILSLKRAWPRLFAMREQRQYKQQDPLVPGCSGSTVGLISLGKIGRLVARHLAMLDVNVLAWDPHVSPEEAARLGTRLCPLPELFASSHVVSCHTPLTPETRGFLGRELFASMPRGATFINTARGGLVREDELVAVLQERADLFAVLDVTAEEPPAPDSPLFKLRNVVLTPHIAGSIGPECLRLGRMMVDEVGRYLVGAPLLGEVRQEELNVLA
jgi:phosphoglycerate dehydrogenase-like enzyme